METGSVFSLTRVGRLVLFSQSKFPERLGISPPIFCTGDVRGGGESDAELIIVLKGQPILFKSGGCDEETGYLLKSSTSFGTYAPAPKVGRAPSTGVVCC